MVLSWGLLVAGCWFFVIAAGCVLSFLFLAGRAEEEWFNSAQTMPSLYSFAQSHICTSSHLHICTFANSLINLHGLCIKFFVSRRESRRRMVQLRSHYAKLVFIRTSAHSHICTSSHLYIFTFAH